MSSRPAATAAASVCRPEQTPPRLPDSGTNGLPPPKRLRKRAEFLAVRRGEKRRGRLVLVEALDRGDGLSPRVGYTVTKKVGNAVVRNRVRRRLREAVRVRAAADMAAGHDYVIVGRKDVLNASFEQLAQELSQRFRARR